MSIFGWPELITALREQLRQQREDFDKALADKNLQIRQMRSELAMLKTTIEIKPVVEVQEKIRLTDFPQDWQGELNAMLKKEEGVQDGI